MNDVNVYSVVIPTRDRSHELNRAVLSVLSQTVLPTAIIIVNNSKDRLDAQAFRWISSSSIPEIHIFNKPELKGAPAVRNYGLSKVRTPWVAFLDDDDFWLPDKMLNQLRCTTGFSDAKVVYSSVIELDGKDMVCYHKFPNQLSLSYLSASKPFPNTSALLFRTDFLSEIGAFDELLPCSQEYELLMRASTISLIRSSESLDVVVMAYASSFRITTSVTYADKSRAYLIILEKLAQFLPKQGKSHLSSEMYKFRALSSHTPAGFVLNISKAFMNSLSARSIILPLHLVKICITSLFLRMRQSWLFLCG